MIHLLADDPLSVAVFAVLVLGIVVVAAAVILRLLELDDKKPPKRHG
jgi:uncharacterized integral membrane protein